MNDSEAGEDPQSYVTCPFDPAHTFPKFRLSRHLVKCQQQNEEKAKELQKCPFNSTHFILKNKYADHVENCPDRVLLYTYTHKTEDVRNSVVEELNKNTLKKVNIPSDENWDLDINSKLNIIETCKKNAAERSSLDSNSNKPRAERRTLRSEQRKNTREKMNAEEEKKRLDMIYLNSSNGASDSNNRSETPGATVNSFINAQVEVGGSMKDISELPSSSSTTRRGRGKNIPKKTSTIEIGYGRGKR